METNTNTAETTKPVAAKKAAKKIVKVSKADRTPLKKVCATLKIDTKTARRVLRKEKLTFHDLGNRWDLTDVQVKRVKEVLRSYAAN